MINNNDKKQIEAIGITEAEINKQIDNFKKGFPFTMLVAAATPDNGISVFDDNAVKRFEEIWNNNASKYKVVKFVPASGAASRMFKDLFEFREKYDGSPEAYSDFQNIDKGSPAHIFISNLQHFAFYNALVDKMKDDGLDINRVINDKNYGLIIDYVLSNKGLGYASLPKALIEFHKYDDGSRVAMEEHLVEGAKYCCSTDNVVYLHFTISPEHVDKFLSTLNRVVPHYEKLFGVKYNIEYSTQRKSTDTIAVDINNEPFREKDGSMLFRPAGHGALLANLNDIDADIVFIKNIDNVVPDRMKSDTYLYKKVIGGLLIDLKNEIDIRIKCLRAVDINDDSMSEIEHFITERLSIPIEASYHNEDRSRKIEILKQILDRPIRICGMVRNLGEPGGGPFFTKNKDGKVSLQIVESSQVDANNKEQKIIFSEATHFNPVDLVCFIKNIDGVKFDLNKYRDPETGFISVKSKDGKSLKAQELPGLWNGSMADWITIFVEVPYTTFNPVKTVNDLIREEHRA